MDAARPRGERTSAMHPAPNQDHDERRALRSAEDALARVQRSAEAVQDGRLTAGEGIEQILDELTARPALGKVRQALGRSFSPSQPH
jgi:hypothetical protein